MPHGNQQIMSLVVTVIIIGLVMALRWRRIGQMRPLKLERLYVLPLVYAAIVAITVVERPPALTDSLWLGLGLVIGAAIGWYRGKAIRISVDPATHTLNQTASVATFLFIAGLIVVRLAVRSLIEVEGSSLNISAVAVVDALMFLALGLIGAQRLEMYLRGKRLLDEARASSPAA